MTSTFLGLETARWMMIVVALLTLFLIGDATIGHTRKRFKRRAMFTPLVLGGLLVLSALAAAVAPGLDATLWALRVSGWLAVAGGVVGAVYHHVFGVVRQPAGYGWLLHYLMYRAPALAPLGLSSLGLLGVVAARRAAGEVAILGVPLVPIVLAIVAVTLLGLVAQTVVYHYRGAFNNPAMYLPTTAPVFAAIAALVAVFAPSDFVLTILVVLLWATFVIGFVGLGMHLRGFDRMMGGLYLPKFSLWEGPPPWAPIQYAGFAIIGLLALELL